MKRGLYFFLIISCSSPAMEKIWHHTGLFDDNTDRFVIDLPDTLDETTTSDKPIFQPHSLRTVCLNKISQLCQSDARFNATSLSGMPPELASGLLERLNGNITGTKCIRSLNSKENTTYKMSHDGLSILAIPQHTTLPLCILDGKTGLERIILENSLTSDNQKPGNMNNRFVPIKWSSTGKYVYGCYKTYYKPGESAKYVYKVWDSKTGKLMPYTIPFEPCGKLYFSSDDRWLLGKLMNEPLMVYESTTGTVKGLLGPASDSFARQKCTDPLHQWIVVKHEGNTQLYDTCSLALAHTIRGTLKCFSANGALLATEHGQTSYKALIYNRTGELLASIPLKGLRWHGMSFTPCAQILRVYDSDTEHQYSLESKELIKTLNHNTDRNTDLCFFDSEAQGSITLTKIKDKSKKRKTNIAIVNEVLNRQIKCPNKITSVRYTNNKHIVALCDYKNVHFWLHLQTGALIPCKLELKNGTFSYRPIKELTSDEYWVNTTDSGYQLIQLERLEKLVPIIEMLTQKVAK